MAHGVFHVRIDFAEGLAPAVGDEDRIIAEAVIAARREGEVAMHFAFEGLHLAFFAIMGGIASDRRRRIWRTDRGASCAAIRPRCGSWRCGNPWSGPAQRAE